MFAHSDLSLWLKDLQQGSATFNVACFVESNNDSVHFLLRRAKDFFRTDHLWPHAYQYNVGCNSRLNWLTLNSHDRVFLKSSYPLFAIGVPVALDHLFTCQLRTIDLSMQLQVDCTTDISSAFAGVTSCRRDFSGGVYVVKSSAFGERLKDSLALGL